jgi:hypothetical protein
MPEENTDKPPLSESERKDQALYIARTFLEEISQFEGDIKGADQIARRGIEEIETILSGKGVLPA